MASSVPDAIAVAGFASVSCIVNVGVADPDVCQPWAWTRIRIPVSQIGGIATTGAGLISTRAAVLAVAPSAEARAEGGNVQRTGIYAPLGQRDLDTGRRAASTRYLKSVA